MYTDRKRMIERVKYGFVYLSALQFVHHDIRFRDVFSLSIISSSACVCVALSLYRHSFGVLCADGFI